MASRHKDFDQKASSYSYAVAGHEHALNADKYINDGNIVEAINSHMLAKNNFCQTIKYAVSVGSGAVLDSPTTVKALEQLIQYHMQKAKLLQQSPNVQQNKIRMAEKSNISENSLFGGKVC